MSRSKNNKNRQRRKAIRERLLQNIKEERERSLENLDPQTCEGQSRIKWNIQNDLLVSSESDPELSPETNPEPEFDIILMEPVPTAPTTPTSLTLSNRLWSYFFGKT